MFEQEDVTRLSKSVSYYMRKYWKVLPVHSVNFDGGCTCGNTTCEEVGKHPASSNGQNDATCDLNMVEVFWPHGLTRNIGVNAKPSNFFVIDIDPRNGGDVSFEKLEHDLNYPFVDTVEAFTGNYIVDGREIRGRHLYFAYEGNRSLMSKFKESDDRPGIDFKHNGYVVVPPSRHFSGVNYEWRAGHAPWEIDMAEAPQELLHVLQRGTSASSARGALPSGELLEFIDEAKATTPYGAAALAIELETLAGAREGTRNDTLYEVGRHLAELISGGQLEGPSTIEELLETSRTTGLSDEEITSVLFRPGGALEVGVQNPRGPKELAPELREFAERLHIPRAEEAEPARDVISRANILDWEVLFNEEPEPEDWYVPGVICSGRGHSLYSDAGLGKSLLMREVAACLASGKETLGFPSREPLKVLYLDYENNPQNDIKSSLVDMGFDASELANLKVASFPDFAFFDTDEGAAQFIELVDKIDPKFIVIDTVSRVVEGDENANDTWNKFYKLTGMHIKKRGIAYVRLDHEGKNASAGARGGSAKRGDVDIVWHYTRKKDGNFRLTCEKSRGPIENDWVNIERFTSPRLGHKVIGVSGTGGHLPWAEILANYQKFENAISIVQTMESEHGKLFGKDKAWELYKDKCGELGITRKALWEALDSVKSEVDLSAMVDDLESDAN